MHLSIQSNKSAGFHPARMSAINTTPAPKPSSAGPPRGALSDDSMVPPPPSNEDAVKQFKKHLKKDRQALKRYDERLDANAKEVRRIVAENQSILKEMRTIRNRIDGESLKLMNQIVPTAKLVRVKKPAPEPVDPTA